MPRASSGGVVRAVLTNWTMFNDEQRAHGEAAVWGSTTLAAPEFPGTHTLQNWQSEFLAIATMAAFSIYLRQRGVSPSRSWSGAPHEETGSSG